MPEHFAPPALSRRERQIMDIVYRRGETTAAQIHAAMSGAPTYTTVRTLLRILVAKGHLRQEKDGRLYMYSSAVSRNQAGADAIAHVVRTFFRNSPGDALAALLNSRKQPLNKFELSRLVGIVAAARRQA